MNVWGNSWGLAWGGSWGANATIISKGGADYTRYRKYLERLNKISSERNEQKYTKKIREIAREIVEEIPVATPEIKKLTLPEPRIDFNALIKEIAKISAYIEQEERRLLRDLDDELALLLLL